MRSASRLLTLALGTLVSVSLASAVMAAERVPLCAFEQAGLVLLAAVSVAAVVALGLFFGKDWS
jgi:uncharacterized protein (DUF697 family)